MVALQCFHTTRRWYSAGTCHGRGSDPDGKARTDKQDKGAQHNSIGFWGHVRALHSPNHKYRDGKHPKGEETGSDPIGGETVGELLVQRRGNVPTNPCEELIGAHGGG